MHHGINHMRRLMLLSATPTVSDKLLARFIKRSRELGFDTDNQIFVKQQKFDTLDRCTAIQQNCITDTVHCCQTQPIPSVWAGGRIS